MLIIEIHVDTIENAETSPSTRKEREGEQPKRTGQKSKTAGNRFWKAINLRFPGSLIPQDKDKR